MKKKIKEAVRKVISLKQAHSEAHIGKQQMLLLRQKCKDKMLRVVEEYYRTLKIKVSPTESSDVL